MTGIPNLYIIWMIKRKFGGRLKIRTGTAAAGGVSRAFLENILERKLGTPVGNNRV
jgi:hypothetical protein